MLPEQQRSFSSWYTRLPRRALWAQNRRTGQFVEAQIEVRHRRAPPELRRNVACAARRSFLVFGLLVYPSRNLSTKVLTGQSIRVEREVLHSRAAPQLRRDCTCAARRSFLLGCCKLVYRSINLSKKVLTGQLVVAQAESPHSRAPPELRRNAACEARRSF